MSARFHSLAQAALELDLLHHRRVGDRHRDEAGRTGEEGQVFVVEVVIEFVVVEVLVVEVVLVGEDLRQRHRTGEQLAAGGRQSDDLTLRSRGTAGRGPPRRRHGPRLSPERQPPTRRPRADGPGGDGARVRPHPRGEHPVQQRDEPHPVPVDRQHERRARALARRRHRRGRVGRVGAARALVRRAVRVSGERARGARPALQACGAGSASSRGAWGSGCSPRSTASASRCRCRAATAPRRSACGR